MNYWEILGIKETIDKQAIKEAYMAKLTLFHPEEDPEGFQRLRAAYETAIKQADKEPEVDNSPVGLWLQKVENVYEDFTKRVNPDAWRELLEDEVCFQIDSVEEAGNKLLTFLMDYYRIPHEIWCILEMHFVWKDKKEELYKEFPSRFVDFIFAQIEYEDSIDYKKFKLETGKEYDSWFSIYYDLQEAIDEGRLEEAKDFLADIKALDIEHPNSTILEVRYLLEVGDILQARVLAKKLSTEWETDARVWYILGQVEFDGKEIKEAKRYYEKAKELNPNHIGSYLGLGRCYMEEEAFEEAKKCYEIAVEAYPYNGYIRESLHNVNRALVAFYEREHEKQIEDIEVAFKLAWAYFETYQYEACSKIVNAIDSPKEEHAQYYDLLGRCAAALEEYEKALAYFDKWLELEGEEKKYKNYIHTQRGRQFQALNKYEEALNAYEEALASMPESIDTLDRKASTLNLLKRFQEAIEICDKGLALDSRSAHLYMNKAEALYQLGEYREAIDHCEKTIEIYAYFVEPYVIQVKIYYEVKRYEEVLEVAKQAKDQEVENGEILFYKAKALRMLSKVEEAKAIYKSLIEQNSKQEEAYYEIAYINNDEGDYKEAIEAVNKSIELKDDTYKYYIRALAYKNLGLYKEALKDYNYIIKENVDVDYAYNSKGLIYEVLEKTDKAIKSYKKSLSINPNHPTANNNLAELYDKQENYKEALFYYTKQIEVEEDAYYYINRAWCYMSLNQLEDAKKDFEIAMMLEPDNGYPYNGIANIYKRQKNYQEAIEYFKKMIEKEENCKHACRDIGECYEKIEDYENAEKYYTLGIEKFPREEFLYLIRGLLYQNQKEYDKALEDYKKITRINSQYASAYNNMGVVYEKLEDYKNAIKFYTKATRINKKHNKAYKNIANIYAYELEDYTKAVIFYSKHLEIETTNASIYKKRGDAYKKLKENKRAKADYTKAIEYYLEMLQKEGEDPCFYNNIGSCYEQLGQFIKAKQYYNKAIALKPDDEYCKKNKCHESYFRLGKVYEKQKNNKEALKNYKIAYEIDPENEEYKEAVEKLEKKK